MAQVPELPSLCEHQGTHPISNKPRPRLGGMEQGGGWGCL